MAPRVAEHVVRGRLFGPKRLLRVDLHGVSAFGAGDERALIRWEWVEAIDVDRDTVVVRGAEESIVLPSGAFGLAATALAEELERARAIHNRSDVIGRLGVGAGDGEDGE
ncbi:MAG: hypothetical protein M3163_10865 [Actinomycetota bacterium]|nr:hypothetical protein [Actinomycetota bacterium]